MKNQTIKTIETVITKIFFDDAAGIYYGLAEDELNRSWQVIMYNTYNDNSEYNSQIEQYIKDIYMHDTITICYDDSLGANHYDWNVIEWNEQKEVEEKIKRDFD